MERVKITLVDNNYTPVFDTDLYLDSADGAACSATSN